jgi:hypothetical protein
MDAWLIDVKNISAFLEIPFAKDHRLLGLLRLEGA